MCVGAAETGDRAMKLRWRIAWLLSYPWVKILLCLRVEGREYFKKVDNKSGMIVAANHTSNFDPLILGWAIGREIYFLAKEELFNYRPFAWLIRSWNTLPVARGGFDIGAIKRCSQLLRRGKILVLFPEGTRSKTGELNRFKPGAALLALLNQVPVVPCHISGMSRSIVAYWVDRDLVRLGFRRKPIGCSSIRVRFGQPILPEGFVRNRNGYAQLTAVIETRVRELID